MSFSSDLNKVVRDSHDKRRWKGFFMPFWLVDVRIGHELFAEKYFI